MDLHKKRVGESRVISKMPIPSIIDWNVDLFAIGVNLRFEEGSERVDRVPIK